jgi:hypothetical protein
MGSWNSFRLDEVREGWVQRPKDLASHGGAARHGFTIGTFRSSKRRTFRVAIDVRRAKAIPAICVSRMSTGWPARQLCRWKVAVTS